MFVFHLGSVGDFVFSLLSDHTVLASVLGAFVAFLCGYLLMLRQQRLQFKQAIRQTHRDKLERAAELVTVFHPRMDAITSAIRSNSSPEGIPTSPIYSLRSLLEAYAPSLVELAERIENEVNILYQVIGSYSIDGTVGLTDTEINSSKSKIYRFCKELSQKLADEQKKYRG